MSTFLQRYKSLQFNHGLWNTQVMETHACSLK
jgi:hypothetical protein